MRGALLIGSLSHRVCGTSRSSVAAVGVICVGLERIVGHISRVVIIGITKLVLCSGMITLLWGGE